MSEEMAILGAAWEEIHELHGDERWDPREYSTWERLAARIREVTSQAMAARVRDEARNRK
jgi:hypothetical protein